MIWLAVAFCLAAACNSEPTQPTKPAAGAGGALPDDDPYAAARIKMVDDTIAARGIADRRLLEVMRFVPRHEFVPPEIRSRAYDDAPLPIGFGLTISQPYIVATMTDAARIHRGDHVLEIGTGSGYQAAVLAELGAKVTTLEINHGLAERTRQVLAKLGLRDVDLHEADGYFGWKGGAPYDAILVTCAARNVPQPLIEQLKIGGRLVMPIGEDDQELDVFTRTPDDLDVRSLFPVRFGPMIGEAQKTE
ncbi:MAG TPA: protein-L-isoaspartate(D-aspartate) O-methyltransferase [Kofleriaceae bacterium]|nr:protein-L-isoaspartate(D-aspartate) O-methyltransferase [Kofleriaceae bacterium]